jgi:ribonucleoside-diphosphate reductase alpha chain
MDSLGTAISVALQYGVPVNSLVNKFAHQRFEPMGMTSNSDIPFAKSLVDYIFRWFGMQFVAGYREQNAPHRSAAKTSKEESCDSKDASKELERNTFATARIAENSNNNSPDTGQAKTETKPTAQGSMSDTDESFQQDVAPTSDTHLPPETQGSTSDARTSVLDQSNAALMGDAPACDVCGSITVRNGTCYKCLNCGNSMGCS